MPDIYRSASDTSTVTSTRIQALTGDRDLGEPDVGFIILPYHFNDTLILQQSVRYTSFRDGLDNTILFVEAGADRAVPWTKSEDLNFDFDDPLSTLGNLAAGKFLAAIADGATYDVSADIRSQDFIAMATRANRDLVDVGSITARDKQRRGQVQSIYGVSNRSRLLSLAMHNFADSRAYFPYRGFFDENGYPFLSWRVEILPYLGFNNLYNQFRRDEPWDSVHNLALLDQMPDIFQDADDPSDSATTRMMVFTGPGAPFLFRADGDQIGLRFSQFRDGTSNTIMLVKAGRDRSVPWTKPTDLPFWTNNPVSALGDLGATFHTTMFDARHEIRQTPISADLLSALITYSGEEDVFDPPPINTLPNFFIYETGGDTAFSEMGADWVDIVLDRAPESDVVLELAVSNTAVAVIDKPLLTYTAENWNVAQRVALRGVDNLIVNADRKVELSVEVVDAMSDDSFDDVASQIVQVTVYDDELQPVEGDFDDNRIVDDADYDAWEQGLSDFHNGGLQVVTVGTGDADGDKDIDGIDFLKWQRNFGAQPTAGDFDFDEDVDSADRMAWEQSVGEDDGADYDFDVDSDGIDFLAWQRNFGFGVEPTVAGDFNQDEFVNDLDQKVWEVSFGQNALADSDGDGDTDGGDFLAWQRSFGTKTMAAISITAIESDQASKHSSSIVVPAVHQGDVPAAHEELAPHENASAFLSANVSRNRLTAQEMIDTAMAMLPEEEFLRINTLWPLADEFLTEEQMDRHREHWWTTSQTTKPRIVELSFAKSTEKDAEKHTLTPEEWEEAFSRAIF